MNQISSTHVGCDASMSMCDEDGHSERRLEQARRLLDTLGYRPECVDWDERRRFLLFDKLAKIAMGHAVDAERGGAETSECGIVAQCAMEMVFSGKAFSPSLIAEVCGALPPEADLFSEC